MVNASKFKKYIITLKSYAKYDVPILETGALLILGIRLMQSASNSTMYE
jgi:hypothetical protein